MLELQKSKKFLRCLLKRAAFLFKGILGKVEFQKSLKERNR